MRPWHYRAVPPTAPVVVEFEYVRDSRNRVPEKTHEVRVMRQYPPQAVLATEMNYLECDCPRAVRPDRWMTVWHAPECPEIDRNA